MYRESGGRGSEGPPKDGPHVGVVEAPPVGVDGVRRPRQQQREAALRFEDAPGGVFHGEEREGGAPVLLFAGGPRV